MNIVFSKLAKRELDDACHYYNRELEGLGNRFREDIRQSVKRIAQHPQAWSIERGEIRKYVLHRFPYKILYSIETNHLFIIAVAHQHRRPDYWVEKS